ncbi:MAG: HAMP domain-containing histidine kinase, partial [Melioribacteraceae bacterium]|nr:HAMP domain-containing histidine kinase [Melioribacteraceae bacterium]
FNIINTSYRNLIIICFSALILSIAIGILYARSITKHIAKLKYQSDDFRKGNLDAIKRIDSSDEIGSLGESLYEMSMQVKSLVNQLKSEVESSKKAENEIKSKNKELRKINAEKDKFFSILAHDLKSPFNSLLGLSELIISEIENFSRDELLEYSKSFYSSISNLYKLIENLLEWAQLQRGTLSFEQSDFNMHSIIQDAIDTYKENIRSKEIVVVNKVPHNQTVYADSNMINSVIRNLLSNAVKFTMRKGTITFQAREIKGNRIHVTVRDSGVGISKSDLKILFDLDDKVRRKGTEGEPSTGLGLMLCKEFIEKNGGVLWVESEPGKGSAFNFTLNSQTVTD